MEIDIDKKLRELETNTRLREKIESVLAASIDNKKITLEQIAAIEKIKPGAITDSVVNLRDYKATFEELTYLHKGLLGSGLLAIIALLMKLFGGGGSGGGGGGGGGGGSSPIVKKIEEAGKIAKENNVVSEKLDDAIASVDIENVLDTITDPSRDEALLTTVDKEIINEVYSEVIDTSISENTVDQSTISYSDKKKQIKQQKGLYKKLINAAYVRCIRLAPYEIIWNDKINTLSYLSNSLLDKFEDAGNYDRTQIRSSGGPGMAFVNALSDYLFSVDEVFKHLEDNKEKMIELFNKGYGRSSEEYPLLKLPPSYVNYILNHSDHTAGYKSEITDYNAIWHGSVKMVQHLRSQTAIPVSPETLAELNNVESFSSWTYTINRIEAGLSYNVLKLNTMQYDLTNPEFAEAINNIERIYKTYKDARYFPTALNELYRDVKEVEKFTKNILTSLLIITSMYNRVEHSMKKYSATLRKQTKIVERLIKYKKG